jgi:hypothetical protein
VAVWSGPSAYSQLVSLGKPATGATQASFTDSSHVKPRVVVSSSHVLMLTFGAIRRVNALEVGFPLKSFGFVFSRLVHMMNPPCLHAVGVLFEAGAKQAYETISFAVVKVPA